MENFSIAETLLYTGVKFWNNPMYISPHTLQGIVPGLFRYFNMVQRKVTISFVILIESRR